MADTADGEFVDDTAMAKVLINAARAQPEKAAALAQAFLQAGIQVAADEIGEAETAAWLRQLASLVEHLADRKALGNRIN
jgi:SOS response regulatory protein OraA/RecX